MSSKVKEVETSQQNQWTYRTIKKPWQSSILNTQNYRALRTKDQEPRLEYWVTRIDDQELRIKLLQELFEDLEILCLEKTISFTCLHDTCTWLVGILRIIVQPFNSERKCLKYNIMMNILTSLLLIKNWEKTQTQIKNTFKGWI